MQPRLLGIFDHEDAEGEPRTSVSDRNRSNADRFAARLLQLICELQANDVTGHQAMVLGRERRRISNPQGREWSGLQVQHH